MKVLLYYNAEKLFSGVNVCYVIFIIICQANTINELASCVLLATAVVIKIV
jgi:hypothetical protein